MKNGATIISAVKMRHNKRRLFDFLMVCALISGIIVLAQSLTSHFWNSFTIEVRPNFLSTNESVKCSTEKNLIIGAAMGLNIQDIWRFTRSARLTCSLCYISLFIHRNQSYDNLHIDLARLYNVTWLIFEDFKPNRTVRNSDTQIHKLRWWLLNQYFNLTSTSSAGYDNVFLTDVRDVVFQSNIFEHMLLHGKGLYVFQENPNTTIGNSSKYEKPINNCFGKEIADRLRDKTSFCAGTTLGTYADIRRYVAYMFAVIANFTQKACTDSSFEQHFHYYIIHISNLLDQVTVHKITHETGFVASMYDATILRRNRFGLILNDNGDVYAVVHQVDHSQPLLLQYQREYELLTPNDLLIRESGP